MLLCIIHSTCTQFTRQNWTYVSTSTHTHSVVLFAFVVFILLEFVNTLYVAHILTSPLTSSLGRTPQKRSCVRMGETRWNGNDEYILYTVVYVNCVKRKHHLRTNTEYKSICWKKKKKNRWENHWSNEWLPLHPNRNTHRKFSNKTLNCIIAFFYSNYFNEF